MIDRKDLIVLKFCPGLQLVDGRTEIRQLSKNEIGSSTGAEKEATSQEAQTLRHRQYVTDGSRQQNGNYFVFEIRNARGQT